MNRTNYNFIAPFYKTLSRIVFGKGLEYSAAHFLNQINAGDKVLIVGGGNGEILKQLYKKCPGASITYCDLSRKFIGIANKKNPFPLDQIVFLEQDAFTLAQFSYDWVVFPFFLDLFEEKRCISFLKTIKQNSKPNTKILFADLYEKGISKGMLWLIFLFFKITTGLKTSNLPDFNKVFMESGWRFEEEEFFSKGKVVSRLYK